MPTEKSFANLPNRYLVGFYDVEGIGQDSVETPCTGNGPAEYHALNVAIAARHPGKKSQRVGSVVEYRDPTEDPGYIDLGSGQTLRQLFDVDDGEKPRTNRVIGRVFFSGTPCNIMLTFNRSGTTIGLVLLPRIKTGSPAIPFSNVIQPQAAVEDLERIVREVLGSDAHALTLRIRPAAPKA